MENFFDLRQVIEEYMLIHEEHWVDMESQAFIYIGEFLGEPAETSEELFSELLKLGYTPSLKRVYPGVYELRVFKTPKVSYSPLWLHILLLVLTFFTTLFAGALHAGIDPFKNPFLLYKGLPFSLTLMAILGTHEMGHYLLAKKHGVKATLPYFIPFPHPLIGTLGAFIRIKSPIPSKNALMDIGAAGPLAGMIMALPLTFIGVALSKVVYVENPSGFFLGDSLLFKFIVYLVKGPIPRNFDLLLHPVAFAGWLGFFVTALNLIPIAQLDGGHIAYALFDKWHRIIARVSFIVLIILGIKWPGWWTWAILILLILRFDHPATLNEISRLDRKRKIIGLISGIVFVLTFIPVPFYVK